MFPQFLCIQCYPHPTKCRYIAVDYLMVLCLHHTRDVFENVLAIIFEQQKKRPVIKFHKKLKHALATCMSVQHTHLHPIHKKKINEKHGLLF